MEIPNILKQRKQLAKLVLDYDSARARCVYSSVWLNVFLLVRRCILKYLELLTQYHKSNLFTGINFFTVPTFQIAVCISCFFLFPFRIQMVAGNQVNNLRNKHSSTDGQGWPTQGRGGWGHEQSGALQGNLYWFISASLYQGKLPVMSNQDHIEAKPLGRSWPDW